jgi:hypothetical protein
MMASASEKLLLEVIANTEELVNYEMEQVDQPPRGTVDEVGHYRVLNGMKFNAKQRDALRRLMEELAFNVATTIFAVLDNSVETEIEDFPKLAVIDQASKQPINTVPLHEEFERLWNEGADMAVDVEG